MRRTREELDKIKKDHNVMDLYSWSKYNTGKRDLYEYFLKYVIHAKEDRTNSIYGIAGGVTHTMLEEFYLGKMDRSIMADKYEDDMLELKALGFKFDRSNKEKNDKIEVKYNACNKHFFENFTPIEGENIKLEEFLLIWVGNFLFQGYSDMESEEVRDGVNKKIITDFKTSTIYKGEKILKERGQLLLYALGKMQEGWAIEDIVIRWLFTKYVHVDVPYGAGRKTRVIARNEIGDSLTACAKGQLKKCRVYTEEQADAYADQVMETKSLEGLPDIIYDHLDEVELTGKGDVKKAFRTKVKKVFLNHPKYTEENIEELTLEMIMTNDIECLPEEVRDLIVIRDCFVEIPFEQDDIDVLVQDIKDLIFKVNKLKFEYKRDGDDKIFYQEITYEEQYFLAVLCGYSPKLHKPYKEYLDAYGQNRVAVDLSPSASEEIVDNYTDDEVDQTDEMLKLFAEFGIDE